VSRVKGVVIVLRRHIRRWLAVLVTVVRVTLVKKKGKVVINDWLKLSSALRMLKMFKRTSLRRSRIC